MVAVAVNETSPEIKLAGRYRLRGTFVASTSFVVQKTMDSVMPLCWCLSRPRRDGENSIFRTQPLVNNLYQGMALDPVTGLYYERARWYRTGQAGLRQEPKSSRRIGTGAVHRETSQDPLSYINGANTYQSVTSDPVGYVDPSGLLAWWTSIVEPFTVNSYTNQWQTIDDKNSVLLAEQEAKGVPGVGRELEAVQRCRFQDFAGQAAATLKVTPQNYVPPSPVGLVKTAVGAGVKAIIAPNK